MYFQTAHASLVAHKHVDAKTCSQVPNPEGGISRAGDGSLFIEHLETPDCGCMAAHGVDTRATVRN